jgi:hypothetical protein
MGVGEGGTDVGVGMNVGVVDGIISVGGTGEGEFPEVHAASSPRQIAGIRIKPHDRIRDLIFNRLYSRPNLRLYAFQIRNFRCPIVSK